MTQPRIQIPECFDCLYKPEDPHYHLTHFVYHGGRSAMKSWNVVRAVLVRASNESLNILCVRQYRESMRFSVKALIENQIKLMGLEGNWEITHTSIKSLINESEFVFYGMDKNPQSSKSFEGCDVLIAEEARDLSRRSLQDIIPTVIRNQNAKCIWIFNPEFATDPVFNEFITNFDSETTHLVRLTYLNNPFCTEATIKQAEKDKKRSHSEYSWQWLGHLRENSEEKVFSGRYSVEKFETEDLGQPYQGLDFGYSQDPTVLVKCYIHNDFLYVRYAKHKVGLELDNYTDWLETIPEIRDYPIKADGARPDVIGYLRRQGWFNLSAAKKPKGSIEFGVAWIKNLDGVIIHPDAEFCANEFRDYAYIKHARSGEITSKIEDKHNHSLDAIRYCLVSVIYNQEHRYSGGIGDRRYTR